MNEIDEKEKFAVAEAMMKYGGSFVKALGRALMCADRENTKKIKETFSDYWEEYKKWAKKDEYEWEEFEWEAIENRKEKEKRKLELAKANIKSVIAILETAAEMDSKDDIMTGINEAIRLLKDIDEL